MHFGLIPETLLDRLALRLGRVPTPLADTQVAFTLARAVMTGVEVGAFEALAEGPRTAADVAAACGTDPSATAKLLDALAGARYLRTRSSGDDAWYELTAAARRWLLRDSPQSLCDKLLFQRVEWELAGRFGEVVRTGEPVRLHDALDAEGWALYGRAMRDVARLSMSEVGRRTAVPRGAQRLLDLGGAHGLFSAALCRRHAGLHAVVLDRPKAVAVARPLFEAEPAAQPVAGRVEHRCGDALADDLGEAEWDVILAANLLHHLTADECADLTARVARALRPGGRLVVQEFVRPATPREMKRAGLGAVLGLYFAATSRSGTWSLEEIAGWQRDAGLLPRRAVWLRTVPGAAQQAAEKPRPA